MPPYQFRGADKGRNDDKRPRPEHKFTFRFRPTSERPLLAQEREKTPEFLGSAEDAAPKFAHLDELELTDTDEADMDVSDSENGSGEDGDESRPRKKQKSATPAASEPPKWSNPDPYTVLPPPDESRTKRPDFVKLIRKARLATAKTTKTDEVTTNEDFISLDFNEEDYQPPENAPTGPKANRKRTHDDELKGFSIRTGRSTGHINGEIVSQWRAGPEDDPAPWLKLMEPTLHVGTRLHNEILAFYNWVKPRPYEEILRRDLIRRLQSVIDGRYYGAELHAFGSFASGLYLPMADMDLVLMSSTFIRTGRKVFLDRKGQIYAFAAFIRSSGFAVPNSVETIAHAKVPILKFVDRLTGLRIDLSFDNDSGVIANRTFQKWKKEYPVMPIIVAVIKQFLLLRGLNEVVHGGLGGYSIICLVVSLLQHMPQREDRSGTNLGSILMDFFDFYGNKFDYSSVGIRMNPPGFFNKLVSGNSDRKRLAIEDPNNPSNDISGGSKEVSLIFECFSAAYEALKERAVSLAKSSVPPTDRDAHFLSAIIPGCYDAYIQQRAHLRALFEQEPQFEQHRRLLNGAQLFNDDPAPALAPSLGPASSPPPAQVNGSNNNDKRPKKNPKSVKKRAKTGRK